MQNTSLIQKKTLHREWKFTCESEMIQGKENFIFKKEIDNVKIVWNFTRQVGMYTIDDEPFLIYDWETLESLMEQIS